MKLDKHQLAHLTHLAALESSDADTLGDAVSSIIELVDQLQQVDTHDVSPLAHPLDITQPLRADLASEGDNAKQLASIAPAFEDNVYLVPKVIESE